jgi:ArsR family transcriptional regulator
MNILSVERSSVEKNIANILKLLGHKTRVRIILEIGAEEACVCHLVNTLGERQAYISQQLMVLRDAGILKTRKEGRFVYYSLASNQLLDLLWLTGILAGTSINLLESPYQTSQCLCPKCHSTQK